MFQNTIYLSWKIHVPYCHKRIWRPSCCRGGNQSEYGAYKESSAKDYFASKSFGQIGTQNLCGQVTVEIRAENDALNIRAPMKLSLL